MKKSKTILASSEGPFVFKRPALLQFEKAASNNNYIVGPTGAKPLPLCFMGSKPFYAFF